MNEYCPLAKTEETESMPLWFIYNRIEGMRWVAEEDERFKEEAEQGIKALESLLKSWEKRKNK